MKLYLRQATLEELQQIMTIIETARVELANRKIPQWQAGTGPNEEMLKADILSENCYVLILESELVGIGVISEEKDPAYEQIKNGQWETKAAGYASIHRAAVSSEHQGKGLAVMMLRFLINAAVLKGFVDIRIDTHPKNEIMQKVIQRAGFEFAGEIELEVPDGERYAYQISLN
ncbi:GNAT family N-acetyltransferase [Enterococcus sp. BWB1-3]|uniref:GNAT family N-acetyltransferase n=1 Tax=unclassified Enterococcus TaxID=2608891 RepID=UPI001921FC98|nr:MULTISPECIES: GNAT family N-acetyltransferase [unclassified Enterococcus]MBL1229815.1 GNAT family N-acetyltransferase [Enterococcus sp. BWB1-3]MCB5952435.1 GNAT family N-acetyltransferase [Enterococcus sp. BWT-B8]MCB5955387.1 GNAT family N-acetyltransferase [Enterococcus sp. CWB-B31]